MNGPSAAESQNRLRVATLTQIGHVVVGNPENRRLRFFQEALCEAKLPRALEVSYEEILRFSLLPTKHGPHPLASALTQACRQYSHVLLRIDSAGESFEVDRLMLACGASQLSATQGCQAISAAGALRLSEDRGRLRYLRQYFEGFAATLLEIHRLSAIHGSVVTYNSVPEILLACDKVKCSQWLRGQSVPVTPAMTSVSSFDEFIDRMQDVGWNRVFIKHRHGSSAAGVIALDASGEKMRATTTMEMSGCGSKARFHNNLKLRTYTKVSQIRKLVNFLCGEGVQVEKWLPRASQKGCVFDLRMVVIDGRCTHVVVRTSRSPITNLHLGNRRGDLDALKQAMGARAWQQAESVAEQAAAAFPRSLYLGIDLLVQPGFRSPTVIEVNALGDLLPGVVNRGRSTYQTEVRKMLSSRLA